MKIDSLNVKKTLNKMNLSKSWSLSFSLKNTSENNIFSVEEKDQQVLKLTIIDCTFKKDEGDMFGK